MQALICPRQIPLGQREVAEFGQRGGLRPAFAEIAEADQAIPGELGSDIQIAPEPLDLGQLQ